MWKILRRSSFAGAILVVIGMLVWPTPVQTQFDAAPLATVTAKLGFNGGTSGSINATGANLLVACVSWHATGPVPTFSDSKGNPWTQAVESREFLDYYIRLYYSVPTAVGSGHTFTAAGPGSMASINVTAWSGATASPLDQTAGEGVGGTTIQPGPVTPTQNDELLISCLTNTGDTSNTSRSINGGFTISGQIGADHTIYSTSIAGAYLVQTTAATANPTWSYPVDNTANAVIATFKTGQASSGDLASKPLLYWNTQATLVGGFRTPDNDPTNAYSGHALAYHDNKLYMGVRQEGPNAKVLQMNIPSVFTNDPATMHIASLAQPAADITDGNMTELHPGLVADPGYYRNWGLLVHGGKLIGSAHHWYDADNTTRVSHFSHSLSLSQSSFAGWMAVWDNLKTGYVSGSMAAIPDYAQAELGNKPVLATAAGGASIASRLSFGHAAFSFDPGEITGRTPFTIAAHPLMYFTEAHPMFPGHDAWPGEGSGAGQGGPNDQIWNLNTRIGGIVIPVGSRTLLYFGKQGTGDYCYGQGTANIALHGSPVPPANDHHYCYDPVNPYQGGHAYPYRYQVWAFDLLDLVAVKNGADPWSVQPYAWWPLEFPVMSNTAADNEIQQRTIGGVAYDAANKAIYVTQLGAEPTNYANRPIIWKFTHQ